jgi:hypothetical protein
MRKRFVLLIITTFLQKPQTFFENRSDPIFFDENVASKLEIRQFKI